MANIDEELRFLRDATDSDAIISRAAISEALKMINEDRAYPPRTLKAVYNGEYETDPDHPYTKIEVEVNQDASSNLTVVPCFVITENGKYVAAEMFGKNSLITEFVVDVNSMTDKTPQTLQVTSNGEYEAAEDEFYRNVIVNVPTAGHEGDLLTAEFYFFDPSNPNDMSLVYICKDEGILFGESALEFISRFPKFKNITSDGITYIHDEWNPDPHRLTSNQLFIPTWDVTETNLLAADVKPIDFEIFMYLVNHDILTYFYDYDTNIDVLDDITKQALFSIIFRGDGIIDADGNKTHYCFSISANDPNASTEQYELDSSQSKWTFKNWGSFNKISGKGIWHDGNNIYYSSQYIYDAQNDTWLPKTWYGLTNFSGEYIWTDGIDVYYSNYKTQYVLNRSTSTWEEKTFYNLDDNFSSEANYIWTDGTDIYYSFNTTHYVLNKLTLVWEEKTWNGITSFNGQYIWTDGTDIYYSYNGNNYILNKSTSTWEEKTWTGLTNFSGEYIWHEGANVYYSYYSNHYILNKNDSRWETMTWESDDPGFLSQFTAKDVWTDGIDTYISTASSHYILNKNTYKWEVKTWYGYNYVRGEGVWTDGTNIYYSYDSNQYILNISTSTWEVMTWYNLTTFRREYIWTDGTDFYYSESYYGTKYVLNKSTSTWEEIVWHNLYKTKELYGNNVWSISNDIYYTRDSNSYILNKATSTWEMVHWNGYAPYRGEYIWTDGTNIFYSSYTTQYMLDMQTSTWISIDWRDPTDYTTFSMYAYYIWTDGTNIYYSYENEQYILDTQNISHQKKIWHNVVDLRGDDVWTDGNKVYYSSGYRNYNYPYFCQRDISDISSQTPVSDNDYYWWGCSLVRAMISRRRDYLTRQNDIDVYDNCGWNLYNLIPQELMNVITPISHYITHPKAVANNYPYKHKSIPRKNLSIAQGEGVTYQAVLNPSGNPREQGWYTFNSSTKQFSLTTDTSVRSGTTYYYTRDYYELNVDEPSISDIFRENDWGITQASAWSDYDLNLKHSPILYINQENGQYKAYKKENLQFVEYNIQDHIKFVRTHLSHETMDCIVRYWSFIGLQNKIKNDESIEENIPILMEDVYYLTSSGTTNPICVYLFSKDYKIYYTFNPRINDEQQAYNAVHRYEWNTDQAYITGIDNGIANGSNIPIFEKHTYTEGEQGYNKEFDVWPDEDMYIYATGNYFEKDGEYFIDPETGGRYRVDVYYTLRKCNQIQDVYFYNYYDLANGYNSCIPAYHYVKQNGQYVLERVDTDYTGYNTENTEYYAQYVSEKVTDKFLTSTLDEDYHRKNDIYAPPYACYRYIDSEYNVRKEPNIINTHLLEFVDIVKTVELNQPNDKSITTDINYQYIDMFTYMSDMRNSNRNIYADEATIVDFEERERLNSEHPETYPLYTYEQASGIWQRYYNEFTRDYSMLGPHNSYQQNGTPQKYNEIYFYL